MTPPTIPQSAWLPIDSAPKDGSYVIIARIPDDGVIRNIYVARWSRKIKFWTPIDEDYAVDCMTHWMPREVPK